MKEQIEDLALATKEETITAVVENECFREIVIRLFDLITNPEVSAFVGSIIGAAAPRVNGVFLTYKQKRFERNMTKMIETLADRVTSLETKYLGLNEEMQARYNSTYVEMLLDNIVDERQEEKIEWNINGFVSMMSNDSNDNVMQIFFDTLSELTVLDVDVLKMHDTFSELSSEDVRQKYGIDYDQMKLVQEKLARLGLLTRRNDVLRDTNIDEITEYLQNVEKDKKRRNPKGVKLPSKIKKIGTIESYRLSSLGRSFLIMIGESS